LLYIYTERVFFIPVGVNIAAVHFGIGIDGNEP
jgi:hypothetical protein